jgi:hypothetical protein
MRSQSLMWGVLMWQPLAALSVQQHAAQLPMLPDRHHTTKSAMNSVVLRFVEDGRNQVRHAEMPLRQQISSGVYALVTAFRTHSDALFRYRVAGRARLHYDRKSSRPTRTIFAHGRAPTCHVPDHAQVQRAGEGSTGIVWPGEGMAMV